MHLLLGVCVCVCMILPCAIDMVWCASLSLAVPLQ